MTLRLPVLFCLLFLITGIRGEDFDLSDAVEATVKPTPEKKVATTAKPAGDAYHKDFELTDVFGEDGDAPTEKPHPGQGVMPTPEKKLATTAKPADAPKPATSAPKPGPKPVDNEDFDLSEAVGGDENAPTQKPQPGQRGGGGGGGSFSIDDLSDAVGGDHPSDADGHHKGGEGEGQEEPKEKQSVIAGVLSALGVAAVGAISSFIAYQKKKLCFKGQAEDPENVNMDNQKGDQNDPQAQMNLLSK